MHLGVEQTWLKSLISKLLQVRVWGALDSRVSDIGGAVLEGDIPYASKALPVA